MSGFKNPYDPNVELSAGCACGAHATPAEHDAAVEACSLESGSEALHARVVESAVMRALFPHDEMRRRFLRAVGASTALAAISHVFPARRREGSVRAKRQARKAVAQGRLYPDHLRDADHHVAADGLLRAPGLNVDVVKTAGWAVIRDKTLNKEYDAAHMLSPMPLAITLGVGSQPDSLHDAGGGEHQRPGDHARRSSTRTSATRSSGRASSSRCPSTTRCTTTCCAITSRSTASIRTRTSRSASVPPPEMVANLRADNIDGFLAPDPVNQRAVYDGVGFIHMLTKEIWDGHPCCAFAASKEFVTTNPNTYRALLEGDHRRHRVSRASPRTASRSRRRSRRRITSTSR